MASLFAYLRYRDTPAAIDSLDATQEPPRLRGFSEWS